MIQFTGINVILNSVIMKVFLLKYEEKNPDMDRDLDLSLLAFLSCDTFDREAKIIIYR